MVQKLSCSSGTCAFRLGHQQHKSNSYWCFSLFQQLKILPKRWRPARRSGIGYREKSNLYVWSCVNCLCLGLRVLSWWKAVHHFVKWSLQTEEAKAVIGSPVIVVVWPREEKRTFCSRKGGGIIVTGKQRWFELQDPGYFHSYVATFMQIMTNSIHLFAI